jgi:hypothetical protein
MAQFGGMGIGRILKKFVGQGEDQCSQLNLPEKVKPSKRRPKNTPVPSE